MLNQCRRRLEGVDLSSGHRRKHRVCHECAIETGLGKRRAKVHPNIPNIVSGKIVTLVGTHRSDDRIRQNPIIEFVKVRTLSLILDHIIRFTRLSVSVKVIREICLGSFIGPRRSARVKKKNLPALSRAALHARQRAELGIGPLIFHLFDCREDYLMQASYKGHGAKEGSQKGS